MKLYLQSYNYIKCSQRQTVQRDSCEYDSHSRNELFTFYVWKICPKIEWNGGTEYFNTRLYIYQRELSLKILSIGLLKIFSLMPTYTVHRGAAKPLTEATVNVSN